jgi:hypothetical protein
MSEIRTYAGDVNAAITRRRALGMSGTATAALLAGGALGAEGAFGAGTASAADRQVSEPVTGLNMLMGPGDFLYQLGPVPNPLAAPARLTVGHCLWSPARAFRLVLQNDGDAALQVVQSDILPPGWPNTALSGGDVFWANIWDTGTANMNVSHMDMQYDGNLVIYMESGGTVWASNTVGNDSADLRLRDDGNLIIYSRQTAGPGGQIVWTSNTSALEAPGANWT